LTNDYNISLADKDDETPKAIADGLETTENVAPKGELEENGQKIERKVSEKETREKEVAFSALRGQWLAVALAGDLFLFDLSLGVSLCHQLQICGGLLDVKNDISYSYI
jgi:hypothetical protein